MKEVHGYFKSDDNNIQREINFDIEYFGIAYKGHKNKNFKKLIFLINSFLENTNNIDNLKEAIELNNTIFKKISQKFKKVEKTLLYSFLYGKNDLIFGDYSLLTPFKAIFCKNSNRLEFRGLFSFHHNLQKDLLILLAKYNYYEDFFYYLKSYDKTVPKRIKKDILYHGKFSLTIIYSNDKKNKEISKTFNKLRKYNIHIDEIFIDSIKSFDYTKQDFILPSQSNLRILVNFEEVDFLNSLYLNTDNIPNI